MEFTIRELADVVAGTIEGHGDRRITRAAGLDEAGADAVTFVAHARFLKQLDGSPAGAVLLAPDVAKPSGFPGAVIRVASPHLAFARILERFAVDAQRHPSGIHATAVVAAGARLGPGVALGAHVVVEDGAAIGDGTVVYPLCYIGREVRVGRACLIYPHVTIRERVQVGDRVILHPGVVLGSDGFGYVETESGHHKVPQIGTVVVEDDVELGANVTVDRATTGVTRIGRGTKVDNLVQIAHNVQIGEETLLVSQVGIGGSTRLGRRVILAGQVGVIDHMKIGDGAVVTAQSGISRNVEPGEIVSGSPARPHREHQKMLALLYRLQELFDQVKQLVRVGAAPLPPARRDS